MAPLRSADWRFLLPVSPDVRFAHLVLRGGPRGSVERAVSLGLGDRVTDQLPQHGEADGVVAFGNATDPVEAIARAVGRHGVLYMEIDRRQHGRRAETPARAGRTLARAGFTVAAVYAVEPAVAVPQAFVPLGSPAAVRWFRDMLFRADTPLARLKGLVRYSTIALAGRFGGLLLRRFVIVAARDEHPGAPPGVLRDAHVARTFDGAREAASAVVVAYGGDRVIMFPFADDGSGPLATVKVPKSQPFFGRTENEQSHLHGLRARLDPALVRAIPRPLGLVRSGRTLVASEQFVPGRTVASRAWSRVVRFRTKRDDLRCAMAWLIRFHRATESHRVRWSDDIRCAFVDEPLRAYASEIGTTREEAVLFARMQAVAATLPGVELPIVCQHRDFAAWNLLRDHGELAVLDWEGAREGPALGDALHLATTWLYLVRRGGGADGEARCVHDLFLAPTAGDSAAEAARRSIDEYANALHIDRRLFPLLVVHHRVELALRLRDQQRLQNGIDDDAGANATAVRAVRVLATGVDRLFGRADAT